VAEMIFNLIPGFFPFVLFLLTVFRQEYSFILNHLLLTILQ